MQSQYADLVKRGQSLNITNDSALMQSMTVQNNTLSLQILRKLAWVKCFFVTFSNNEVARKTRPGATNFSIHRQLGEGRAR